MGAVGDERPVVGESEAVEHFSGVPAGAVHGGHPCSELAAGVLKNSVEQNLRASRLRDVKSEELTMNIRFSGGGGGKKKINMGRFSGSCRIRIHVQFKIMMIATSEV